MGQNSLNSKLGEAQKLKSWTKKTKTLNMWQNSKTKNVANLTKILFYKTNKKMCDKIQELKIWQNSRTKNVTKLTKIDLWQKLTIKMVTKLISFNFYKTQIVKKFKNWNCDKTQKLKFNQTKKILQVLPAWQACSYFFSLSSWPNILEGLERRKIFLKNRIFLEK